MDRLSALGLMSGTSYDGVDVALIETDGESITRFGPTGYRAYREDERALIRQAMAEAVQLGNRHRLAPGCLRAGRDHDYRCACRGGGSVSASERLCDAGSDCEQVGFPGQTVLHDARRRLSDSAVG